METHKQNSEPLFQLSANEILAVQEMRKRKAQEKETPASRQELRFTVPPLSWLWSRIEGGQRI
jgi:hypothetical protein